MPGYDRTGPEGYGPMSGRRMGRCAGYGRMRGPRRHGFGFHRMGAWRDEWDAWELEPAEEIEWLEREESFLQKQLKSLQEHLTRLRSKQTGAEQTE